MNRLEIIIQNKLDEITAEADEFEAKYKDESNSLSERMMHGRHAMERRYAQGVMLECLLKYTKENLEYVKKNRGAT